MPPKIGDTYTDPTGARYAVESIDWLESDYFLVTLVPPDDPAGMSIELDPDEWADFVRSHRLTASAPA